MDAVVSSQPVAVDRLRKRVLTKTLTDKNILVPAIWESFKKLDPRVMWRNPVMFAVEVVAALTTNLFVRDIAIGAPNLGFSFQIILWLWFTVLFANFAEAVAEGRGKAQAASLRETKTQAGAKLIGPDGSMRSVPASSLKPGDIVLVSAGELIPSDG